MCLPCTAILHCMDVHICSFCASRTEGMCILIPRSTNMNSNNCPAGCFPSCCFFTLRLFVQCFCLVSGWSHAEHPIVAFYTGFFSRKFVSALSTWCRTRRVCTCFTLHENVAFAFAPVVTFIIWYLCTADMPFCSVPCSECWIWSTMEGWSVRVYVRMFMYVIC